MSNFLNCKLPHFCSVKINYVLSSVYCYLGGVGWGDFLLNHVLTRSRRILHRTARKQQQGLCRKKGKRKGKNEQLQLLRKQSMPISHYSTSTSTFFKGINLKLKWKTSCFRSAPKIFERQLLNQNTAPPFFLSFPLLCWGFLNDSAVGLHQGCLQGCAILSFNLPLLRLSSVRHASLIFMENEAHDINLVCFFAETWEQMWKVQTIS